MIIINIIIIIKKGWSEFIHLVQLINFRVMIWFVLKWTTRAMVTPSATSFCCRLTINLAAQKKQQHHHQFLSAHLAATSEMSIRLRSSVIRVAASVCEQSTIPSEPKLQIKWLRRVNSANSLTDKHWSRLGYMANYDSKQLMVAGNSND